MTAEPSKVFVIKRTGAVREQSGTRIAVRYLGMNAEHGIEWYEQLKPAVIQGGIEVIEPGVLTYKRPQTAEKVHEGYKAELAAQGLRDRLEIVPLDAAEYPTAFRSPLQATEQAG